MSLGFFALLVLLSIRIYFRKKTFGTFVQQFLFGIFLPYIGILSLWLIHIIHAGFVPDKIMHMFHYWDFRLSTLLILVITPVSIYKVYTKISEIVGLRKALLNLPHRRFKNIIILKVDKPLAFTLGVLKPLMFISEGVLNLEKDIRNLILLHEKNHIKSLDNLKILLFSFFLPSKRELTLLKAQIEIANDYKTLKFYPKETLIKALKYAISPHNIGIGISDEILMRLETLKYGRRKTDIWNYVLFVFSTAVMVFIAIVNCPG